jgi:hypothetical protein
MGMQCINVKTSHILCLEIILQHKALLYCYPASWVALAMYETQTLQQQHGEKSTTL